MDDLSRDSVVEAVDRAVEGLLEAAGLTSPPVDVIAMAQRQLDMVVCIDRCQEQRGRAHRAGGRRQIFLRPEHNEDRHQWTVAHEIGEHLKPGLLERLGVAPDQTRAMAGESLANLFAHRLLVPSCWFSRLASGSGYDLLELKQAFPTASHEVIAFRLLDLSVPCIITIVDNGHIHRRRSNAWPTRKELHEVEQECQKYVHHFSRPRTVCRDGWTVQCWPLHQADWKREILRSVVDEA